MYKSSVTFIKIIQPRLHQVRDQSIYHTINRSTYQWKIIRKNCIVCQEFIRPRQEAFQCDGCQQWCHRKCNTGITRQDYRAAVQAGESPKYREQHIRLISERKLKIIQRTKHRQLQARIFDLWEEYENNNKTARQLLKACSYLNGPLVRH